ARSRVAPRRRASLCLRRGQQHRPRIDVGERGPDARPRSRAGPSVRAADRADVRGRRAAIGAGVPGVYRGTGRLSRWQDAVRRTRAGSDAERRGPPDGPGQENTRPSGGAVHMPVSPDGKTLFVSLWGGSKILVFDAVTLESHGAIEVGDHPNAMA